MRQTQSQLVNSFTGGNSQDFRQATVTEARYGSYFILSLSQADNDWTDSGAVWVFIYSYDTE